MVTSSFKSTTSRDGTRTRTESSRHSHKSNPKSSDEKNPSTSNTKKPPLRRSQSVSAISRTKLNLPSEFLNKIDNPLFSSSVDDDEEVEQQIAKPKTVVSSQRGRSITRNADLKGEKKNEETVAYNGHHRHRSVSRSRSIASNESPTPAEDLFVWEDALSAASQSETEEKTIKAVWEQTKPVAVVDSIVYTSNNGIDMTNPVPVVVDDDDLVLLGVRRDYTRKLNECHERARRLRADLAAEENHEQELGRILKDILSEPMTNVKSPPTRRKKSSERSKMSRRLAEEARTYFDECVSISTFDSSDFSATEDATSVSVSNYPVSRFSSEQESITDQSGCKIAELGMKFQFSDQKRSSNKEGIGKLFMGSSSFNIDDYKLCSLAEELLYERVLHRNRIESGNLHLCGGGGRTTLHSFSSMF